jgi:hypothetical protein
LANEENIPSISDILSICKGLIHAIF